MILMCLVYLLEQLHISFRYCVAFCGDLIPHVNECLHALFPAHEIGGMFGVTASQFKTRFGKIGFMETAEIIQPLEEFLPPKEAETRIVANNDSAEGQGLTFTAAEPDK